VNIHSIVEADKPVQVTGKQKVIFTLAADKYWERSFVLEPETVVTLEGTQNALINNQYTINLVDIKN